MITRVILFIIILGFIAAGIYSYVSPTGSARLWAPVTNFIQQYESSSTYEKGSKAKDASQKEIDSLGFGPKE